MNDLIVLNNTLTAGNKTYTCALGKLGVTAHKREGDHKTPVGRFALRACYYRADRIATPETALPRHAITPQDGWCDDPAHPEYNRKVTLPFAASHEKLWREDPVYDVVVAVGYNDEPVVPGKGSAVFLHVARENYEGTEGCVALALADLLQVLGKVTPDTYLEIIAP